MPSTEHFGFTKLCVADLEATTAFYEAAFGFVRQHRVQSEIAGRAIDEVILAPTAPGASPLILLHFVGADTPVAGEVILGLITADMDALVANALAHGGSVAQLPYVSAEAGGMRVGFVTDNEGHLIEVVERRA